MTVYENIGRAEYRGHQPGERFEATLDPLVEARALKRGNISVVARTTPRLVEGSYRLPNRNAADAAGQERSDDLTDTDQGRGRDRPRG